MAETVMDLTKGIYRRIYSGALYGKRVNSVSAGAELLLWRIHMVADDLGNFPADSDRLAPEAMPLRNTATPKRIAGWLGELAKVKLITTYESGGEQFGHVCGWMDMQPANRNGRRIQKYPGANGCDAGNPGESKAIQGDPGESRAPETETETESETYPDTYSETETSGQNNSGGTSDSDSSDKPIARPVAKLRFFEAVEPALGSCGAGSGRHPAGSPQYTADHTVVMQWWDEVIWPDGRDPPECIERFEQVVKLAHQAKTKRKPMAWLTARIKTM